ncbi:hypothetical protein N656DRAFT_745489 [Canariomyces notabilis]|uniref:Elongin-A n=1 Tax=Canariomyces notabilis TaxID=2074819 RepID=A0AAN6TL40_9PEZI|nr:hypothetical protein N656DRAFT_745489 [Canariomyces arenarius]
MPGPKNLVDLCIKVAADNVNRITSLGSLPSNLIAPIIKAVKTAEHLRTLELNSDDIYDVTAEQWPRIIKKDFPILVAKHNLVAENPESWHKVWQEYKHIQDEEIAAATEKLKQDFAAHKEQKDARGAVIISPKDTKKLRLPRPPGHRSQSPHWSLLPRQKRSFLSKARAELAVQAKHFRLATPTGKLPVPTGQLTKAPEAMVNNARIALQTGPGTSVIRAPRQKVSPATGETERQLKQREARLLQIKKAGATTTALHDSSSRLRQAEKATAVNTANVQDNEGTSHPNDGEPGDSTEFDDLFGDDLLGDLDLNGPPPAGPMSAKPPEVAAGLSSQTADKLPIQPRRGLLSAAPGTNKVTRNAMSSPEGPASANPAHPGPRSEAPSSSPGRQGPAPSSSMPSQLKRKRTAVDLCMRTDRKKRSHV